MEETNRKEKVKRKRGRKGERREGSERRGKKNSRKRCEEIRNLCTYQRTVRVEHGHWLVMTPHRCDYNAK